MRALLAPFAVLLLCGCLDGGTATAPTDADPGPFDAYDEGRLFALNDCDGVELAHEWLGPHGPNGPAAPPAQWQDPTSDHDFAWSLEVLECDRLGWGPLERGPVSIGLEVHTAYEAPEACYAGLEETVYLRYLHRVYLDDPDAVEYAASWGLPVVATEFSRQAGALDSVALSLGPAGADPSTMEVHRPGVYEGEAADINVAFFWFQGDLVHRLTLHRETRLTLADLALADMEPPSIMGDVVVPQPASASWLTNLHWTGDLVTFGDAECTTKVFP